MSVGFYLEVNTSRYTMKIMALKHKPKHFSLVSLVSEANKFTSSLILLQMEMCVQWKTYINVSGIFLFKNFINWKFMEQDACIVFVTYRSVYKYTY